MADALVKLVKTVNFGTGLSGRRSFVFYEVFDTLGTGSIGRTNSGVYELGTSSGIYGTQLMLSQSFSGSIVWQVTGSNSTVVFASDEIITDPQVTRYFTTGKWQISRDTNQMVFFREDNVTEVGRYDLQDEDNSPSVDNVFIRTRI
jgi:hypothetical protein